MGHFSHPEKIIKEFMFPILFSGGKLSQIPFTRHFPKQPRVNDLFQGQFRSILVFIVGWPCLVSNQRIRAAQIGIETHMNVELVQKIVFTFDLLIFTFPSI
jgi:hypothetical protein